MNPTTPMAEPSVTSPVTPPVATPVLNSPVTVDRRTVVVTERIEIERPADEVWAAIADYSFDLVWRRHHPDDTVPRRHTAGRHSNP